MSTGPRLGIDFGTSHTVSLVAWPDGRVRPLLFDGSPLLPSAVCADSPGTVGNGSLLVGRDALHAARIDPSRFEGTPKRRIDDGTVLLGSDEYPVTTLITAVLSRVREEAIRVIGGTPQEVIVTHPAAWGVSRRLTLLESAKQAGLGEPTLIPEPVAAARYFAGIIGDRFVPGSGVLVYDFGGGTFDASLVVRKDQEFDVRAVDGIDDLGGLDLDAMIVEYARTKVDAEHAEIWQRLAFPQSPEDRRHHRVLWDDAKMVKERLSRSETAVFHVPLADMDVTVARSAFEDMARQAIERTARTTAAVLRWSALPKEQLVGVFLVGGSSRIPLVTTVLQRELGIAPTVLEQPEMVVAEGALRQVGAQPPQRPVSAPPRPMSIPPMNALPMNAPPMNAPPRPVNTPPRPMSMPPRPVSAPPPGYPASVPPRQADFASRATYPLPQLPVAARPQQVVAQRPIVLPPAVSHPSAPMRAARPGKTRWMPFLAVLFVVAALAAGYVLWPNTDDVGGTDSTASQTASPSPYVRQSHPEWVPAEWVLAVSGSADTLWETVDEDEGGRCEVSDDVLRVTRSDNGNLTGCTIQGALERTFEDVAIETEITVVQGCNGLWARTGNKGYFLTVCNGYARLERLEGNDTVIQLGQWDFGYTPEHSIVGFMVVGTELTVYLDGVALGDPITDDQISYGRVTFGGHPGDDSGIDVSFSATRIFTPADQ